MTRSRLVRINKDMYEHLRINSKKNDSNFRIESKKLFSDYTKLKAMDNRLKGKKVFVIGKKR